MIIPWLVWQPCKPRWPTYCGPFCYGAKMATCVMYVDESGDANKHFVPIRNGQPPLFTLTGLVFPLKEWRNIDRDFLALKKQFFSSELSRSKTRAEHYEIKGNTLTCPANKHDRRRHKFIEKVCELASAYNGKLFCVTIIKDEMRPAAPVSIYTSSLQYLVERFNIYIAEHGSFDKGLIIADSTKQFDWDVAVSHMSFIFGTDTGRALNHIYEAPLFANSKLTAGIQISDILSSAIFTNHYRYYCRSITGAMNYDHMQQHWERINSLQFRSTKHYDGYPKYGFRIIDHKK